jgi:PhnB protein
MQATLEVPWGGVLMEGDHPQGKKVQPTGFCVSIQVNDTAEAERIFNELSEGAQMQMQFQKTFWSPGCEVAWMVNCVPNA